MTFTDWHRVFRMPTNVTPINRAWDYRRDKERKEWLKRNTRPMPPEPPRTA